MKKNITLFMGAVILTQGASAVGGLLMANWMEKIDYAIYTIVITTIGAVATLTKGGVQYGLSSVLSKVWPDKEKSVSAVTAADFERRRFGYFTLPIILILCYWMLSKNGVGNLLAGSLLIMVVVQWYFDATSKAHEQILQYASLAHKVQVLDLFLAVFRLVTIVLANMGGYLSVIIGVIINVIISCLRKRPIKKMGNFGGALPLKNNVVIYRNEIRQIANRQIPLDIFFIMQMQFVMYIITRYGETGNLAEFGALSRLGQIVSPVSALIGAYVIPIFSRASKDVGVQAARWLTLSAAPGFFMLVMSIFMPEIMLILIGKNYAHLEHELKIFSFGILTSIVGSTAMQLTGNRGWNKFSALQVPITMASIFISTFIFDVSKLTGVLWMLAFMPIGQVIAFIVDFAYAKKQKLF